MKTNYSFPIFHTGLIGITPLGFIHGNHYEMLLFYFAKNFRIVENLAKQSADFVNSYKILNM